MKKQTIVVDIDDTMAAEAGFIIDYSNAHWGTNLTLENYQENWTEMWGISHKEGEQRADELHQPGIEGSYSPINGAREVLTKLAQTYRLIILTSRRSSVKQETLNWLVEHFGDIFDDVHFTGFYDEGHEHAHKLTKGELIKKLGADFLIDDQLKHCLATAELGVTCVLFGDYSWNKANTLPKDVTRCKDWEAVLEYFDGQRR